MTRAYAQVCLVLFVVALAVAAPSGARADVLVEGSPEASPYPKLTARPPFSFYLGVQAGTVLPVGLTGMFSFPKSERLRWELDLTWEPSLYLQSYSLGLDYHFLDGPFILGARTRYVQLHPPFTRGFQASVDNQFAVGPEIGWRFLVESSKRLMLFVALGVSFFPTQTIALPPLYTLNLGFAIGLGGRR